MLPLLFATAALAAPPALDCPEGQAQLHKKATACCWEGQAWDKKARRCTGEPTCLEGFEAYEPAQGAGLWVCRPVAKVSENAGVLGALQDGQELDGVFGSSGLDSDLVGGVGGLIGAKGTQIGSGGLGSSGTGLDAAPAGSGVPAEGVVLGDGLRVGGDPIILGALDKLFIDAGVLGADDELNACTQGLADAGWPKTGKVVIKFVIMADGTVSKASIKSSTLADDDTHTCLTGTFMPMTFPPPKGGGIVIASYPFIVGPTD